MFKKTIRTQCDRKEQIVEIQEITEVLSSGNGADKKFIRRFCSEQNHCVYRTVCPVIK